jgi:hypothetical protein
MVRKTHPLTDTQIKAVKPRDKNYSLFDVGSIHILVKLNNAKIRRL